MVTKDGNTVGLYTVLDRGQFVFQSTYYDGDEATTEAGDVNDDADDVDRGSAGPVGGGRTRPAAWLITGSAT